MVDISVSVERWPIKGSFTIARGSKTEAIVVVVTVQDSTHIGRGECVPYARYGETVERVCAEITSVLPVLQDHPDRLVLQKLLPPGAARNALDCALWDYEAKKSGQPVWQMASLPEPAPVVTAFTLSLASPDEMFARAQAEASRPLLKIKLGANDDLPRLEAVRAGAPASAIIVDANEGWSAATAERMMRACADNGVVLIEQPLPASEDALLKHLPRPVPVCADESCHTSADVSALSDRYDGVNIKLDKTGGLTEALQAVAAARAAKMHIMIGCMVGTSLGMAPALVLAAAAQFVDLDGPLLLAEDRPEGLQYEGSLVRPPQRNLWG